MAGTCECGNEPSGSIKCREFLKKDSAPRSKQATIRHSNNMEEKWFHRLLSLDNVQPLIWETRTGQPTGGPHNSLQTCLRTALVYTYIKGED